MSEPLLVMLGVALVVVAVLFIQLRAAQRSARKQRQELLQVLRKDIAPYLLRRASEHGLDATPPAATDLDIDRIARDLGAVARRLNDRERGADELSPTGIGNSDTLPVSTTEQ